MTAQELFDLAPIGKLVKYSDGKPQPPARFKRKLKAWQNYNSTGKFIERNNGFGSGANFTLETGRSEIIIFNQVFSVNSTLNFEVLQ